jgi:hypothetical protein
VSTDPTDNETSKTEKEEESKGIVVSPEQQDDCTPNATE